VGDSVENSAGETQLEVTFEAKLDTREIASIACYGNRKC
jgi:hypothetical protein